MKPWCTDRPDLERRDRVRDVKQKLAKLLDVVPYRVDEVLRQVAANPDINASAIVVDALRNKRAAGEITRLLSDLLMGFVVEVANLVYDQRIEHDSRAIEASERTGREASGVKEQPGPQNNQQPCTENADGKGDAWEGDE